MGVGHLCMALSVLWCTTRMTDWVWVFWYKHPSLKWQQPEVMSPIKDRKLHSRINKAFFPFSLRAASGDIHTSMYKGHKSLVVLRVGCILGTYFYRQAPHKPTENSVFDNKHLHLAIPAKRFPKYLKLYFRSTSVTFPSWGVKIFHLLRMIVV